MHQRRQNGFSLVELSIVLVLVGLLIGGILGSRQLILSARAKDVIAIVEDLRTATDQFKQRYHYLPGDWPYTAGEINGIAASPGNGNGLLNGAVNPASGLAALNSEVAEAPFQLYQAGLIARIDNSNAQRRLATAYGPVHMVAIATAELLVPGFTAQNPSARNVIVFANLPCEIVAEVDRKIDNGNTDNIQVVGGAPGPGGGGKAFGSVCANDVVRWYAVVL